MSAKTAPQCLLDSHLRLLRVNDDVATSNGSRWIRIVVSSHLVIIDNGVVVLVSDLDSEQINIST